MTTPSFRTRRPDLRRVIFPLLSLGAAAFLPASLGAQAEGPTVVLDKITVEDRITNPTVAVGTDRPRNTISITREALLAAPAGISALKMLDSLPGFNVQTSDAFGLYEFGNSVTVRAFNYQQIGFILDGAPLGRSDQFGGSPIYRYVDNENLARVTASQGTGDVTQPGYASLGPVAEYSTLAPGAKPGVQATVTTGSNDLLRTFVRLQSGRWGGLSAYVSRSEQTSDQWRGPGTFDREHWDGKVRYDFRNLGALEFSVSYNDYFDYDSPSINQAQYAGTAGDAFGRSGRYFAYLGTVPVLAETTPGITYSNTLYNQFYKQAINARTDALYNLTGTFAITPELGVKVTAYHEDKEGYGVSPEAYATSLASYNAERLIVPGLTAPKGLQYGLSTVAGHRKGAVAGSDYKLGRQVLSVGGWLERDQYHRTQARYNQVGGSPDGEPLRNEPVHFQRDFVSVRDATEFHARDVISFADDKLKLDVGFKSLDLDYSIAGYRNPGDYIASRQPTIKTNWSDGFLPQAGLVYSLSPRVQLFTSYAENLSLPRGADDIYVLATPAAPPPDAERSKNYEAGVRTNGESFNAVLAVYRTIFDNRLQSFSAPVPGSSTTETFFQNVGAVEAYGAELSAHLRPAVLQKKASFNLSASYNVAKFQDNFPGVALADKVVPDTPRWLLQYGVTYEPVKWAAVNLLARSVGQRYTNFLNTEQVGGFTTYALYVDLGGNAWSVGPLKNLKVRLNVDNLTDKDYLGTINVSQGAGVATFRPGPDRTFQLSVSGSF